MERILAGALVGARRRDFFTTEVWTGRGLVTYYTVFVIELHSRRVRIGGATRYPDEAFVLQAVRAMTDAVDGVIGPGRLLICDRDPKWSSAVEAFLEHADVRIIRTPAHAPNCNAYAERFVRSIKEECLDRLILSASAISGVPWRSSWRITTRSGTTKASGTN